MENPIPSLPDDVLLQIFLCLPVESLLRFRCLSKSWDVLISGQHFAKLHLNRSLIDPKPLGLIWKDEFISVEGIDNRRMHIFTVDCTNLDDSALAIQRLHHPFEVPCLSESTLIGSCNGLICLLAPRYKYFFNESGFNDFFVVVNPLTRRYSFFYGETACNLGPRSSCYGFGYDDAHDDYKVVTYGVCPEQFGAKSDCSKFEVYSTTNGSWSTRISGLTDCYVKGTSCGVLVNCTLHWISINNEGRYCIVAFDLRIDQHRLMETPENDLAIPMRHDHSYPWYSCRMELGVLNGSLCAIVDGDLPRKLDLWVMKEYDIHDSWIKMTIDMLSGQFRWLGVISSTRKGSMTQVVPILHMDNKKQMILYSYVEGFLLYGMVSNKLSKVFKIPIFDCIRHHGVPMEFSYVQKEFCFQGSLVELPGFDSFDVLPSMYFRMNRLRSKRQEKKTARY